MTTTTQRIATGTWRVDPIHSSVAFNVEHNGVSTFNAGFNRFDATLTVTDDGVALSGAAAAESVQIDEPQLRGHLMSPEFFDSERYPEVRFHADDIRIGGGGEVELDGELTIRDTTKPIAARGALVGPSRGPDGGDRIGLSLETVVDRTDYGFGWNMELPDGTAVLANDVTLVVRLELVREDG
jgi:polyisoprenoid-binding protein YceI